jgi:hypothetical protein
MRTIRKYHISAQAGVRALLKSSTQPDCAPLRKVAIAFGIGIETVPLALLYKDRRESIPIATPMPSPTGFSSRGIRV